MSAAAGGLSGERVEDWTERILDATSLDAVFIQDSQQTINLAVSLVQ